MKSLPAFRKRSCHNLSGADPHSSQTQTVSQFSEPVLPRSTNWRLPPLSYNSSLPSLPVYTKTRGGRGRGGRGVRKRLTEMQCFPTAKRGRDVRGTNDDFDEILSSYHQRQSQALSGPNEKEDHVVHEILDSPPRPSRSSSPPHLTADTCHSRSPSSSSSADLNAVQRTYLMQERESSITTPTTLPSSPHTMSHRAQEPISSVSKLTEGLRVYHTRRYDKVLKELLQDNTSSIEGVGPAPEGGVVSECINVDDEDDCQITETTASQHSDTSDREVSPFFPDPFTPTAEEEVMKFKKATANFRNSTRQLPNHLASRSPSYTHPSRSPPLSPTHSNRQSQDILQIVDSDKSPRATSASTEQTSQSRKETAPAEHPPHTLTTHTPHTLTTHTPHSLTRHTPYSLTKHTHNTPLLNAVSRLSGSHGNQLPKLSKGLDFDFVIECPPLPVRPSSPPPTSHPPLLTKSPSTPLTTHNDSDDDSDFEPVTRNYSSGRRGKREKGERERGEERGRGGEREREEARGRRGERGRGEERGRVGERGRRRGRGQTSVFNFTEQSPPPRSNCGSFYRG